MATILFFQSTTKVSWRRKLRGVLRAAKENNWFVHVIERDASPSEVRKAIETWLPLGCIVDRGMSSSPAPDLIFSSIPTVYLDQNPQKPSRRHPSLIHDSAAEARLAGQALMDLQCKSYVYLSTGREYFWDSERRDAFAKLVKSARKKLHLTEPRKLKDTLGMLPTPIGLLAVNDHVAIDAYHAAAQLDLSIPKDLAIIGIDNDSTYCESVTPGLSSAEPDFEGAGYKLVKLLEAEIAAHKVKPFSKRKPIVTKYGPLRLVERGSSRKPGSSDPRVEKALEYIRQHACETRITLDAIVAEMKCSRKLATLRFRKATGHSILDEIHEHRLNNICEMLRKTEWPILDIIYASGYSSQGYPMKFFRKRTGMTMREWRKQNVTQRA